VKTNIFLERVALVTGGGSGIGRSLCLELARNGAKVIVVDVDAYAAALVVSEIEKISGIAAAVAADVSIPDQIENAVQTAVSRFGRLDFMFNNAGIALVAEMYYMDLERWKRMIDINLMGVIYGTHHAYQVMCRQGSGHIINTASLGGLVPGPLRSAYISGKFGVVGLTLSLRTECRKYGVQASVVCPGAVRTPIFQTAEMIGNDRTKSEEGLKKTKMMDPDVAARKILYGIARNKGIIVMDSVTKTFWGLFRLSPSLFEWLVTRITVAK
jgi:NAD(P)-dependent dehydrogenase (short-subunit alcohol dehydrogenase family)